MNNRRDVDRTPADRRIARNSSGTGHNSWGTGRNRSRRRRWRRRRRRSLRSRLAWSDEQPAAYVRRRLASTWRTTSLSRTCYYGQPQPQYYGQHTAALRPAGPAAVLRPTADGCSRRAADAVVPEAGRVCSAEPRQLRCLAVAALIATWQMDDGVGTTPANTEGIPQQQVQVPVAPAPAAEVPARARCPGGARARR